ncbi:MAG: hypothetical protein VW684_13535, partial [Betaproteobacteria bacterium]
MSPRIFKIILPFCFVLLTACGGGGGGGGSSTPSSGGGGTTPPETPTVSINGASASASGVGIRVNE